jgi:hypothetical protein
MWNNQKMKFKAFIHNDEEKCFYSTKDTKIGGDGPY